MTGVLGAFPETWSSPFAQHGMTATQKVLHRSKETRTPRKRTSSPIRGRMGGSAKVAKEVFMGFDYRVLSVYAVMAP